MVMNNVDKYLKIARDAVIKPSGNIEEKIISRISNIDSKDKNLLDDRFLDFFKKSNSRLYLTAEKIKNTPGVFATFIITAIFIFGFLILIIKIFSGEEKKGSDRFQLSSSKDEAEKK